MQQEFEEQIKIMQDIRQKESFHHLCYRQQEEDIWCDFVLYCHCEDKKGIDTDFFFWLVKNGLELPFWTLKWICETKFGYNYEYKDGEWFIHMPNGNTVKAEKSLKNKEILK